MSKINLKVGDKVRYIRHSDYGDEDPIHFKIGNIYKVEEIDANHIYVSNLSGKKIEYFVFKEQLELYQPNNEELKLDLSFEQEESVTTDINITIPINTSRFIGEIKDSEGTSYEIILKKL